MYVFNLITSQWLIIIKIGTCLQKSALATISSLLDFYKVHVQTKDNDDSNSNTEEIALTESSVNIYMIGLLAKWGMDWRKVQKIDLQRFELESPLPQLAGTKQSGGGESSKSKEKKKPKK